MGKMYFNKWQPNVMFDST